MSEAQLVFLFIAPMSSESWYVRVALSANHSLHTQPMNPLGTMEKQKAALWRNTGWKELFRKEWVKQKKGR